MKHVITGLKQQQRNPNRINVYLDGEFAFGVSRIVAAWLFVGKQLSNEEMIRLQQSDEVETALQQALRLISIRPRSEAEIRRRLEAKEYNSVTCDAVLQRLLENGLIGDSEFARTWVENRSTFRPRSYRLLSLELRQKGVAEETIGEALEQAGDEDELAFRAARIYARRLESAPREEYLQRLMTFLARRGFTYDLARDVSRQVWEENQSVSTASS